MEEEAAVLEAPPSDDLPSRGNGAVDSATSALPEDVLADVLRRLPPRGLAVSRCVCKAWRAAVDDNRLLRLDLLLPRTVRGLILGYPDLDYPAFLRRPSATADLDDIDILVGTRPDPAPCWIGGYVAVVDHCNGLLLLRDPCGLLVSNPATRRYAHLPPPPHLLDGRPRLAFDPADSLHYEVFLVPERRRMEESDVELRRRQQQHQDVPLPGQEWPPSTWFLCVFSSRTGRWEERSFAREDQGEPAETTASIQGSAIWERSGAYWRGALYAQCYTGVPSVARISLSHGRYQAIKVPTDIGCSGDCMDACFGRSENGVYFATIHRQYTFRVWILDESCERMKWVLHHHADLETTAARVMTYADRGYKGPWEIQDLHDYGYCDEETVLDAATYGGHYGTSTQAPIERTNFDWDSDDQDNFLDNKYEGGDGYAEYEGGDGYAGYEGGDGYAGYEGGDGYAGYYVTSLGFHPYKPIVFLNVALTRVAAYHLNTSTVQVFGKACSDYYNLACSLGADILSCFPYTPCLMEEFPENKPEAPVVKD